MIRRDAQNEKAAIRAVERLGLRYKSILGRFNPVGEPATEICGRARELFPAGWKVITPQRARVVLKPSIEVEVQIAATPEGFEVRRNSRLRRRTGSVSRNRLSPAYEGLAEMSAQAWTSSMSSAVAAARSKG